MRDTANKLIDNSIHRKEIKAGNILWCEEHDEALTVFRYKEKLFVRFSFENELTLLTDKIIRANNLLKL